jgi:hypothetical protein
MTNPAKMAAKMAAKYIFTKEKRPNGRNLLTEKL